MLNNKGGHSYARRDRDVLAAGKNRDYFLSFAGGATGVSTSAFAPAPDVAVGAGDVGAGAVGAGTVGAGDVAAGTVAAGAVAAGAPGALAPGEVAAGEVVSLEVAGMDSAEPGIAAGVVAAPVVFGSEVELVRLLSPNTDWL
jgi:hypothetical protein